MSFYIIGLKDKDMYVHFNPDTHSYFVGDKILGACGFTKPNAENFIEMILDDRWYIIPISPERVIVGDRKDEHIYFHRTH